MEDDCNSVILAGVFPGVENPCINWQQHNKVNCWIVNLGLLINWKFTANEIEKLLPDITMVPLLIEAPIDKSYMIAY